MKTKAPVSPPVHLSKSKHKKLLIIIAAILAIFIAGMAIFYAVSPQTVQTTISKVLHPKQGDGSAKNGSEQTMTRSQILSQLQSQENIVTDNVSSAATIPNGIVGTAGKWVLENKASNKVEMQVELYFNDQLIATSPVIKPGQYIDGLVLKESIPAGSYKADAYISYYTNDSAENYVGKADYKIRLNVG